MGDAPVTFRVPGPAAPQGSKRAFRTRSGRIALVESSAKVKPYRAVAALCAAEAWNGPPTTEVVAMEVTFRYVRPKSHYNARGQIKPGAPLIPTRIDLDKLARSLNDALTGIVFVDDSQVGAMWICKEWGDRDETVVSVVI